MLGNSIIYLAAPYSDPDAGVRKSRFERVTLEAARLIAAGHIVFSPLTMTHPIDQVMASGQTMGSDYWVKFDESFMRMCSEIYVLQLPGWRASSGVQREIAFFEDRGLPVKYISPETDFDREMHHQVFA